MCGGWRHCCRCFFRWKKGLPVLHTAAYYLMTILFIITVLLLLAYAVLLVYYRRSWLAIPAFEVSDSQPRTKADCTNHPDSLHTGIGTELSIPSANDQNNLSANQPQYPSLTLIIPARNEEAAIGNCLQSVIDQCYPPELLEIIVADDFSTDGTAAIVQSFAATHPHIRLLQLADFVSAPLNAYKKKAIELAIAQSSGQLIVTTDADCVAPPNWLHTIASFYQAHQPAFIAAPVSIDCGMRSIEIFQALDFMTLQGITGASVHRRFHNMCNGANLAYERTAFEAVGGFRGIDHIASGDDMLLMHKIQQHYPDRVMFLKSTAAIVRTAPMPTLRGFLRQRIRWASKADKYDDKRIFGVLLLVYLLNVLLLLWPLLAAFFPKIALDRQLFSAWLVWLVVLLFKTVAELYFLYPVAVFFRKTTLLWAFPAAQPFHILYTVVAGWLGKFGSYQWKERKVK